MKKPLHRLPKSILAAAIGWLVAAGIARADDRLPYGVLSVTDFRAPPPAAEARRTPAGSVRAQTTAGIESAYTFSIDGNGRLSVVSAQFTVFFDRAASWFDRQGLDPAATAAVLKHEQAHLDISEIAARRMRAAAAAIRAEMERAAGPGTEPDVAALEAASPTLARLQAEHMARQEAYDRETRHGIDRERQAAWEAMLARELKAP